MWVYVNYPNPHFTFHSDPTCQKIQMHNKEDQRVLEVNTQNLGATLTKIITWEIKFAAEKTTNDLWLSIELDSRKQEEGLVYVIQALLGQRYKPLANAPIVYHC